MEIIAAITTLISAILTIKKSIWNWPVGLIGILAYMLVFLQQHLYAQTLLQVVFTIQTMYGWWYWWKEDKIEPFFMDTISAFKLFAITIILSIIIGFFVSKTDNPSPYLDTLTTLLSLLATWQISKKIIDGWTTWIITDIFFAVMLLNQKMYSSAILYAVLSIIAIGGLIKWTKSRI